MYTYNKIRSVILTALLLAIVACFTACIHNDLPYPWVQPNLSSFEVQSEDADGHQLLAAPVQVDSASRTVTIYLTEWANPKSVVVTQWELSDGSECLEPEVFNNPLDLSNPLKIQFELYNRVYIWTIKAEQAIERYFTVASQIGTSVIDAENHTVTATVPMAQALDAVTVRSLKLSGPLSVVTPDIVGQKVDFTRPVELTVTEFGDETVWTITVTQTEVSVDLERVDAWTNVAWLYANAEEGKANSLEYRKASDEEWIKVPEEWITHSGGSFTGRLIHLESQTDYVARAISGDEHSAEIEFTTGENVQLPNTDFRDWWKDGKVWNPWVEGEDPFWGSGNRGACTLGQSNTVPIEDAVSPTGYRGARLETKFVGVSFLGKLAAGNLFAGDFVEIDGTNGILDFGRVFTARPTKLKARLKYTTASISDVSKSNPDFQYMKGQPDTCIVWCALTDWEQPIRIKTKPAERNLFDQNDPGVIAYGQFQSGESIDNFIDVVFDLDYRATNRVPRYILVTASASKYGDYFTGGRGATLELLGYELLYDY